MPISHPKHQMEAVVLAAGRSRRMGRPKQLLPLPQGCAVIERVVCQLAPYVSRVVVVVGHLGGQVAALARRAGADFIINHDVERGMLWSVQLGVADLDPETTGMLLCPGDQPELDGHTIGPVVEASAASGIVIPTHRGRGGHPVYVGRQFFDEILRLPVDHPEGLRAVVRGHPAQTVQVELPSPDLLHDIDTPRDYERAWQRLATRNTADERPNPP